MDGIKDFDAFYEIKIRPLLDGLERERILAKQWGIGCLVALITGILFLITAQSFPGGPFGWLAFISLLVLLFSIYHYTIHNDLYTMGFKEQVIQLIIQYLHPGIIYKPFSFISSKLYRASGLYRARYTGISGDDLLKGVYKGVPFQCSELDVENKRNTRRANYPVFTGLFFSAKLNIGFYGGTYIWKRGEEQLGESIAEEHYRLLPLPKVYHVHTGHAVFNKYYSVYSTDPEEAHALVDDVMMENMLRFRKQIERDVVFSFVAGRCYVGIPVKEDLFEPAVNLGDKENAREHFFAVLLVLSIINQLQLNRWV